MRSKASLKSHPIHPMLIAFPIGFSFGALGFDVAGRLGNWSTVWSAGAYFERGRRDRRAGRGGSRAR